MKIKKEGRAQIQNLPKLKIRYSAVVPVMGIVDMLTMLSFYRNPVSASHPFFKVFFLVFAAVGVGFALWGILWRLDVDGKRIVLRPVFGKKRVWEFSELSRAVVHKKAKNASLVYFQLFDRQGEPMVKVYPLMTESAALLERLKRLKIRIEEVLD